MTELQALEVYTTTVTQPLMEVHMQLTLSLPTVQ